MNIMGNTKREQTRCCKVTIPGLIDGVEFIVYDINPKMKGALEQIVEQPLEKLGIDYLQRNCEYPAHPDIHSGHT